ncbi:hypothetical protein [Micromonospora sp. WMMD812]|uniref:hypothetical protein n=1 Tax=Micromonospora sp. WMMD812 TaxID=3015152 RepID=UPI00248CC1D0|nr:hypothetical protein [Micromonospora sp. WMMD812]WBB70803.1 hypothetical protein O7603_16200 [Micromonospora sp. WMMD812]
MAVVVVLDIDETVPERQSLTIEVRSDDARAPTGMAALRDALLRLEAIGVGGELLGPAFVSAPIPLPGAHLLLVDLGPLPAENILAVPELLAWQLRDAGVRDAVVSVVRPAPVDAVEELGPSARAYLRGPLGMPFGDRRVAEVSAGSPSARLPLPLLDMALHWWHAERHPTDPVSAAVLGVQVPLTAETAGPAAAAVLSTLPTATAVTLLAGDGADRLAAATVGSTQHGAPPAAALSVVSPRGDPADLTGRMRRLRDLLCAHAATLLWAGVDVEPDSRRVLVPQWSQRPEAGRTPVSRRPGVEVLADELVPDAMWFQVLSAGHLDRLGGLPPGATPLPEGRAELTVGQPEQWLPGHPDAAAVRARGRKLLAGLLVDEAYAWKMSADRLRRCAPPDSR